MSKKQYFIEQYIASRKANLKNASHGASDKTLKEYAEAEYHRQKVTNSGLIPEYTKVFEAANEKFRIGDPIDDAELALLLDFYRDLEFKLDLMGERFHFAWRDARDNAQRLDDYRKARLEKRTNSYLTQE